MIFTHDPEVIRQGAVFLRIVAFAQIPLAVSFVYAGSLRGAGDTFYVFIVTLLTMWGCGCCWPDRRTGAAPVTICGLGGVSGGLVCAGCGLCLALP